MQGEAHGSWVIRQKWRCKFCNNIIESSEKPKECPKCHKRGSFEAVIDDMTISETLYD